MGQYVRNFTMLTRSLGYPEGTPEEASITPLTGEDMKILAASEGLARIEYILKKHLNFSVQLGELYSVDSFWCLIQWYIASMGATYKAPWVCDNCDKMNREEVDLNKVDVKYADEDSMDPRLVTFPVSGTEVVYRYQRQKDEVGERRYIKQIDRNDNQKGEPGWLYRYACRIKMIDGKDVTVGDALHFIEGLQGKDVMVIPQLFDDVPFGFKGKFDASCRFCGKKHEGVELLITEDFFRPTVTKPKTSRYKGVGRSVLSSSGRVGGLQSDYETPLLRNRDTSGQDGQEEQKAE